jgi:hypothetical protein
MMTEEKIYTYLPIPGYTGFIVVSAKLAILLFCEAEGAKIIWG